MKNYCENSALAEYLPQFLILNYSFYIKKGLDGLFYFGGAINLLTNRAINIPKRVSIILLTA